MPLPRFIQISTLTSYPAALLNRDDSGLAKRIPFGGSVRTRISSQCLKRHWRLADGEHSLRNVSPELGLAVRSRALFRLRLQEPLVGDGVPEKVAETVLSAFAKSLYEGKDKDGTDDKDSKDGKNRDDGKSPLDRSELVVLGEPEIAFLLREARGICAQAEGDIKKAATLAKDYLKTQKDNFRAITCGAGVDGAMFGRFISGDPGARVSAAVHVAHAFTVHQESSETDYFTAVDDLLTREAGGSGHLGATELTSGLYYSYAVIDVPLLVSNLTGCRPEDWLDQDRTLAGKVAANLVQLMATVTPGAKLGSTAPYDYAALVLAEAGERQPRTLANAFIDPVRLGTPDLMGRTAASLASYVGDVDAMYGPGEMRWLASRLPGVQVPGAVRTPLPELAQALLQAVATAGRS